MTAHNLLILDKAIQHHYESEAVICPTQEEVENALRDIRIELERLKEMETLTPITTDQKLVDDVINRIETDIYSGDTEALDELLKFLPETTLKNYLCID